MIMDLNELAKRARREIPVEVLKKMDIKIFDLDEFDMLRIADTYANKNNAYFDKNCACDWFLAIFEKYVFSVLALVHIYDLYEKGIFGQRIMTRFYKYFLEQTKKSDCHPEYYYSLYKFCYRGIGTKVDRKAAKEYKLIALEKYDEYKKNVKNKENYDADERRDEYSDEELDIYYNEN